MQEVEVDKHEYQLYKEADVRKDFEDGYLTTVGYLAFIARTESKNVTYPSKKYFCEHWGLNNVKTLNNALKKLPKKLHPKFAEQGRFIVWNNEKTS